MRNFNKVLETNEHILWEGKPDKIAYITESLIPYVGIALIWLILVSQFLIGDHPTEYSSERLFFLLSPHLIIAVLLVVVPLLYFKLTHHHTIYLATDKRILMQSGLLGNDFESIEYDEIAQTKVSVGLLDLLIGASGSVALHGKYRHAVAGGYFIYVLSHVRNPYQVFKLVEKVSRDVKTEMKYPNTYRPNKNKGYRTKYKEGASLEV